MIKSVNIKIVIFIKLRNITIKWLERLDSCFVGYEKWERELIARYGKDKRWSNWCDNGEGAYDNGIAWEIVREWGYGMFECETKWDGTWEGGVAEYAWWNGIRIWTNDSGFVAKDREWTTSLLGETSFCGDRGKRTRHHTILR